MEDEQVQEQFERKVQAYFAMRDELLKTHYSKWVTIVDGKVAAIGDNATEVIRQVLSQKGATVMYVKRVGFKDTVLKIRQVSVGRYDEEYGPPILKVVTKVASPIRVTQTIHAEFILDTGADLTLVTQIVAVQANLYSLPVGEERIAGIGGIPWTSANSIWLW